MLQVSRWIGILCAFVLTAPAKGIPKDDTSEVTQIEHNLDRATTHVHPGFSAQWEQCGHWQEDYANLHKNILAGKAPQKFMIAEPDEGLADSLACVTTVFYMSVLTNSAFLLRDLDNPVSTLTYGYDQPNIEWAAQPDLLVGLSRANLSQFRTQGGPLVGDQIENLRCGTATMDTLQG